MSIPYTLCKNTDFSKASSNERTKEYINNMFYCPSSLNYTVQGNLYADAYSFIQIDVKPWSGANCKTQAEIDSFVNGKIFNLAIINTYFDFDDYTSPIKTFIDNTKQLSIITFSQLLFLVGKYFKYLAQHCTALFLLSLSFELILKNKKIFVEKNFIKKFSELLLFLYSNR